MNEKKLRKIAFNLDMGLDIVYEAHAWSFGRGPEMFTGSHSWVGIRRDNFRR